MGSMCAVSRGAARACASACDEPTRNPRVRCRVSGARVRCAERGSVERCRRTIGVRRSAKGRRSVRGQRSSRRQIDRQHTQRTSRSCTARRRAISARRRAISAMPAELAHADLLFEEDILRNAYSLKYWWRYLEAKSRAAAAAQPDLRARAQVPAGELQAVARVPGRPPRPGEAAAAGRRRRRERQPRVRARSCTCTRCRASGSSTCAS